MQSLINCLQRERIIYNYTIIIQLYNYDILNIQVDVKCINSFLSQRVLEFLNTDIHPLIILLKYCPHYANLPYNALERENISFENTSSYSLLTSTLCCHSNLVYDN